MIKSTAIKNLKKNINCNFAHAVLLQKNGDYRVELHPGHAGNCCCNEHDDFVWRETAAYTYPSELLEI
jgi:hypothetical protein